MRKTKKRGFAALLAAALLFTMPGTVSYAGMETVPEDLSACEGREENKAIDEPVAKVENEGEEPTEVTSLTDAFSADHSGATITLLADVELAEKIIIYDSNNFTLNLNGKTIDAGSVGNPIYLAGSLAICGNGTVCTNNGAAIKMETGILTLEGGAFSSSANNGCGVSILQDGILNVTSDSVTIDRLYVGENAEVSLTAGTYTGNPAIEIGGTKKNVGDLLGKGGYAYYGEDNQPLDLDDLDKMVLAGPVTVQKCRHLGKLTDNGDGIHHGGDCPYCKTTIAADAHADADGNSKCDGCGAQLAAKVETGGAAAYYTTIETAWEVAQNNTATVTLLADVNTDKELYVHGTDTITFAGGSYTLSSTAYAGAFFVEDGTLTIASGTVTSELAVMVNGGKLVVTGGTIQSPSGNGIAVMGGAACISGGMVKGGGNAIYFPDGKVGGLLLNYGTTTEPHYAYYQDGVPVISGLDGSFLPGGTYTVGVCSHSRDICEYQPIEGTDTQQMTCLACGYTKVVEKLPVNITAEPENSVYDGSPHKGFSGLAADSGYTGGYVYEYKGTGETDYSSSEPPVCAGSYSVAIRVSDSGYEGSSGEIPFVIEKASVRIRADDKSAKTGSPVPELTYTVSGLAGAERLAKEPQLSCSADMDRAGIYPITASGAEVPDTDNYEENIVYVAGKLTVAAKSTGSSGNGSTGGIGSAGSIGSSGNTGSSGGGAKQPFLKDSFGRAGWDVIRAEAEKAAAAPDGGNVAVDMNGASVVPGSIFAKIRDKDVTIAFDMDGGFVWTVNGKDITAETVNDTDFSVKAGTGYIPQDVAAGTSGGFAYLELRLAHDGAFGFAAALSVRITEKNGGIAIGGSGSIPAGYTGMYANLFYYNPALRSLEFVSAAKIAGDGTVKLPFAHASDYALILSAEPMGTAQEPSGAGGEKPEGGQQTSGTEPAEGTGQPPQVKSVKLSKTVYTYNGKAKKPSVTVTGTDGKRIPAKYYTVSYKNNKKVGKAAVTVRFQGIYSGTVKKAFTIRPAGVSIQKLTAATGGFTVNWKIKAAQADGYQVQYSADAGFKGSSTHSVFVKNASGKKVSVGKRTVKKLKAGKKYYVRIRTYKTVKTGRKSTQIYSAWSSAGRVKTPLPALGNRGSAAI